MSFNPLFLSMMSTTGTQYPFIGNDEYAQPSFGSTVNFVCHVTYDRKVIRDDTGTDRVSTAQIQMPPGGYVVNGVATPTISIYDWISLPFDGIQRKVVSLKTFTDKTGVHHQSISLE